VIEKLLHLLIYHRLETVLWRLSSSLDDRRRSSCAPTLGCLYSFVTATTLTQYQFVDDDQRIDCYERYYKRERRCQHIGCSIIEVPTTACAYKKGNWSTYALTSSNRPDTIYQIDNLALDTIRILWAPEACICVCCEADYTRFLNIRRCALE